MCHYVTQPHGLELQHFSAMRPRAVVPLGYALPRATVLLDISTQLHFDHSVYHQPASRTDAAAQAVIFILYHSDHSSTLLRPLSQLACFYKENIHAKGLLPPVKEVDFGSFVARKMCSYGQALGWHACTDKVNKYQAKLCSFE
jgi:hypothetical protein